MRVIREAEYKPFKRGKGSVFDKEAWKYKLDKAKFDQPLDDLAYAGPVTDVRTGEIIDPWGDDESEGPNKGHHWWEVLRRYQDGNRLMLYLYPTDEFGNALTKSQIKKEFPGSQGEGYVREIDNKGWAKWVEYRGYDDEPLSDNIVLIVPTDDIYDYDRDKSLGRKISDINDLSKKSFYKKDARGYRIPSEEALAKWQEGHPGEEYDPEFDSVGNNDRDYQHDEVYYRGNKDTRRAYAARKQAQKDEDDARKAAYKAKFGIDDDKDYDDFAMYSCFSDYDSKFDKYQKEAGMNDEDLANLKKWAKSWGYGHDTSDTPFASKKEFKKWVIEHNGDWETVVEAMRNMSSQFSQARINAWYS